MSVTQTAAIAKCRLRLQDRSTRRDGTAITTPRFSDTDIGTALNDAIRDRQPLIIERDRTFYMSVFDFIGQTNAVAADASNTTLPVVANQQYAVPSTFKDIVRLARRDLVNQPTVRLVPYEMQDAIYYGGAYGGSSLFAETTPCTEETVSLVSYNHEGAATNRLRILPAPASTSYLYRLFYLRKPTEPDAAGDTLDIPATFLELVTLDAAVELAGSVNHAALPTLLGLREIALKARMDDETGRYAGPRVIRDVRL